MPLETATYVTDLNPSNPVSGDGLGQADDHMRLIKSILQNTFPNLSGPVTATQAALNTAAAQTFPVITAGLADASVTTAKIVDANVTTPKLVDGSVTTAKHADGSVTNVKLAANAVATANLIAANVTYASIQNVGNAKLLGNNSGGAAAVSEISLGTGLAWGGASTVIATMFPPPGVRSKLSLKVTSTTNVTCVADFVTTTDGTSVLTTALSGVCNLGANGAANTLDAGTIAIDQWYAIWAIAKADGTTATLASLSFTAPTLPTGYTFKARIGAVQTIHASATLYGTWQFGNKAQYIVGLASTATLPLIVSGAQGTYSSAGTPTWATPSVVRFVPPTASEIQIVHTSNWKGGLASNIQIAPSNAYGSGSGASGNMPPYDNSGAAAGTNNFWMTLEATTIACATGAAGAAISCMGWVDNL